MNQFLVLAVAAGSGTWLIGELLKLALVPATQVVVPLTSSAPAASNCWECPQTSCPVCPEPSECLECIGKTIQVSLGSLSSEIPEPVFHAVLGVLLGLAWWPFCDLLLVARAKWRHFVFYLAGSPPRRSAGFANPLLTQE